MWRRRSGRRSLGGGRATRRQRGTGWRRPSRQFLSFFRGQLLIFLPLLSDGLPLLGRQLPQGLELLPGDAALLRRQVSPGTHLLLDALLLGGRHLRIALSDAEPLLLALDFELVPFRCERSEDLLIGRGKLGPGRRVDSQGPGCCGAAENARRENQTENQQA